MFLASAAALILAATPLPSLARLTLSGEEPDGGTVDAGPVTPDAGLFDFDAGFPDAGIDDGYTDPDTDTQGLPASCNTNGDCPSDFICFQNQCEPEEGAGPNSKGGGFGCGCTSVPPPELASLLAAAFALQGLRRRRR